MMGVLRKVWGAVAVVWVCLFSVVKWIVGRKKGDVPPSAPPPATTQWSSSGDTEWDNWDSEGFSVKVVPDGSHGDDSHGDSCNHQAEDEDLFKDMEPVIRKPWKIQVRKESSHESVNMKMFAVDTAFQPASTELETWSDEEGGRGWEEEAEVDLQQTRETLKAARKAERERRRAEMEQLRQQKAYHHHHQGGHLSLGTRVS